MVDEVQDEVVHSVKEEYEIRDFAKYLRRLRERKGMTQKELSDKTGLPYSVIKGVERGVLGLPSEARLRKWLNYLVNSSQVDRIIWLSRRFVSKITVYAKRDEESTYDLQRILEVYDRDGLTDFDRDMLKLIGR